MMLEYSNI